MDVVSEQLETIRQSITYEKVTPKKFVEKWDEVMKGNQRVRREKYTIIGGENVEAKNDIFEGTRAIEGDDLVVLSWKEGEVDKKLLISNRSFMGVQDIGDGERSLVVVRHSVDENSGKLRETVRRYTPVKT